MKLRSLLKYTGIAWVLMALVGGCRPGDASPESVFTQLSPGRTGIRFENKLEFDKDFNIYTYRNFYNGGGVAMGDINNDGLLDVYLTSNMGDNQLFLNKGNFEFENITAIAGVAGKQGWSTGVSMADVNGDGLLDIYVCNSGDVKGDNKKNELFINNGDLTFTEKAEAYGLADQGFSTHAVFFDYDKDGDLDMYLLNNSYRAIGSFDLRKNEREKRDPEGGDKLFRNDSGRFTDVSEQAGIYGSIIGFGLGVTVGDVNRDGWLDIYVSNDFFERDYLYINNGDGAFSEQLEQQMGSISAASMGADMADINNDGQPDIFVTEMLPEPNERLKTATTFDSWNRYQLSLQSGYYHQFTRNMLQLNNGDNTFSEIGRLAGVEATDWSWGALIFDMDNDGLKDIFVANGIYQDLTNQDYLMFIADEETKRTIITKKGVDYKKLIAAIPSNPVPNYAFHNQGGLQFVNKSKAWGLDQPGFSNGSAYGDLDNDGDLDLVVNNVNMPLFVYRNETNVLMPENRFLKVELEGEQGNRWAVGSKLTAYYQDKSWYLEQMPMRGFQSSVDPRPNFGLGDVAQLDSLVVEWYDGKKTVIAGPKTNQTLRLKHADAKQATGKAIEKAATSLLTPLANNAGIDFRHQENLFVDFDRDRLIYHMLSTDGPKIATGDINGDGLDDFFIGGAKDQAGKLYLQLPGGKFKSTNEAVFEKDKLSEDTDALFFDADGDRDLDLFVCSGGNEFSAGSSGLLDRLYFNDGRGNFTRSPQYLPTGFEASSCVQAADYDNDGDLDLLVGVRLRPFLYGVPANAYLMQNDGKGNFIDVTANVAPALREAGMITDALWSDFDGDKDPDILLSGEWMPLRLLVNEKGRYSPASNTGLDAASGWWNCIKAADLDNDGDLDIVAGNHGLNSRFRASKQKPVVMYVNDFDQNGTAEQIICMYNGDKSYPMVLRHDLVSQMPGLKKKYLKFESYKDQTITDIFTPEQLKGALKPEVNELRSTVFINDGKGAFSMNVLPIEAQMAPMYGLLIDDMDNDGIPDILMGGNFYNAKPEAGRYDAGFGVLLKGDGKAGFSTVPAAKSGFKVFGQIRDIAEIKTGPTTRLILVTRNDDRPAVFVKGAGL